MKVVRFVRYWMPAIVWMAVIFLGSTDMLSAEHTSRFLVPFLRWIDPQISLVALNAIQLGMCNQRDRAFGIAANSRFDAVPNQQRQHVRKQYVPLARVAIFTPLKLRSPVPELYEYVPLIPLLELYGGPHAGTAGSTIVGAKALLVFTPPTDALPESDTVVPAVALPVTWLAPDCSRIEMASLPAERDEARLLYCMGWETANMHFASRSAIPQVKRDLSGRRGRWLQKAAKAMVKATIADWEDWRAGWKRAF